MLVSGPEPRVWHNNLRFKSNLGYISDPSARDHRRLPEDLSLSLFLSLPLISLSLSLSFTHSLTHFLSLSKWNVGNERGNRDCRGNAL